MALTQTDIEKIAMLARLSINEADIPDYVAKISDIIEMVESINTAPTQGITPMAHPIADQNQRLREDAAIKVENQNDFQEIAPDLEAGLYLVPKVIDSE